MQELKTKVEIVDFLRENWNHTNDELLPPVFFGSDMSLIGIDSVEKMIIRNACNTLIEQLYEIYVRENLIEYGIPATGLYQMKDSYGSTANACQMVYFNKGNNGQYQYGDLYVSNSPERAVEYSLESWILGETGWITNRLYEGLMELGIALPQNDVFNDALNVFLKRKKVVKRPIVAVLRNIPCRYIRDECGECLEDNDSFKTDMKITDSFRVANDYVHNEKDFFIVKQDHYNDLLESWKIFDKNQLYDIEKFNISMEI